ncbi:MAG: amino acid-binding protein [Capsulimonadaceae bacterium]
MKVQQLSLFLENEPGQVIKACRALASASIDIRTLMLADTQQYGILRLICSDWQAGSIALSEAGFVVNLTEVVAAEVPDRPGGLASLLERIDGSGVNIEYMYACTFGRGDSAVLIFRFDDPDRAIAQLQSSDVNVLSAADVYDRANR